MPGLSTCSGMLWEKAFAGDLDGVDGGGVLGHRFPLGRHLESNPYPMGVIWVKTLSMPGRAMAAPPTSFPSWRCCLLRPNSASGGGWAATGGCLIVAGLATCSAPRRLVLLGDCQYGMGLHRRTALAAPALRDD